jgi:hypothetical protein
LEIVRFKGDRRERRSACRDEENTGHISLKYPKTEKGKEQLLNRK